MLLPGLCSQVIVKKKEPVECLLGGQCDCEAQSWVRYMDGDCVVHEEKTLPALSLVKVGDGRVSLRFKWDKQYYLLSRVGAFAAKNSPKVTFEEFCGRLRDGTFGEKRYASELGLGAKEWTRFWEGDHLNGDPRTVLWDQLEVVTWMENKQRESARQIEKEKREKKEKKDKEAKRQRALKEKYEAQEKEKAKRQAEQLAAVVAKQRKKKEAERQQQQKKKKEAKRQAKLAAVSAKKKIAKQPGKSAPSKSIQQTKTKKPAGSAGTVKATAPKPAPKAGPVQGVFGANMGHSELKNKLLGLAKANFAKRNGHLSPKEQKEAREREQVKWLLDKYADPNEPPE